MKSPLPLSGLYEHCLAKLDAGICGASFRAIIGFTVLAAWDRFASPYVPRWWLLVWFAVVLAALRILPAIARKVARFPPRVATVWRYRRTVAKLVDSYQWRKLLFFGLGMLIHSMIVRDADPWTAALTVGNLVAGGVGEWVWRAGGRGAGVTLDESDSGGKQVAPGNAPTGPGASA
jgi:hypothetical protein